MGRRAASVRDGVATCLWREKLGADSTAKAAWGRSGAMACMVCPRSQQTRSAVTIVHASEQVS